MEKVKLTREQIQTIRKFMNNDNVLKLTLNELHRVIDGEYEVEETFEAGDWVVPNGEGYLGEYTPQKITNIDEGNAKIHTRHFLEDGLWSMGKQLRHATPEEIAKEKQRRWWVRHGREVWELREGDCLISRHDKHTCQVKFVEASDETGVLLVDEIQDEFYEGEHDLEIMKDIYCVFCFAEDRKDNA